MVTTAPSLLDPVAFCGLCWPKMRLYDKQREILYSVRDNDETYVPAGHELGKDYVAAVAVVWWFCSRRPAMVVTTSVTAFQLGIVLWGEMRRLLDSSEVKLPIAYNHLYLRHVRGDGTLDPRSAVTGEVCRQGEALAGRHIERDATGLPRTLVVFDEASGIADTTYNSTDTWAHSKLIIGNPYPCENFFRRGVKAGEVKGPGGRLYSRVIRVRAEDSPNVRYAQAEVAAGREPSGKILIPGVLDYPTYLKRRATWDAVRQCIGLDGEFWEGADTLLYPPAMLNEAEKVADKWPGKTTAEGWRRPGKAISLGIDTGQGAAETTWVGIDEAGLVELVAKKTPDTSIIPNETLAFMRRHDLPPESVNFDAGGGGKEHADRLRAMGYNVRTVGFGESVTAPPRRGRVTLAEKHEHRETRYVYKNRRAEMYGLLRELLSRDGGFGIPAACVELRRQLAPIPQWYDEEGRLFLPAKRRVKATDTKPTMIDIVGCSPDQADGLVLAVYGMRRKATRRKLVFMQ